MYSEIFDTLNKHYHKKLPFVVYALPDSDHLTGVFQSDLHPTNATDSNGDRFVFAPFLSEEKSLYIPFEHSVVRHETLTDIDISDNPIEINEKDEDKQQHLALVSNAMNTVKIGEAQKIVVSRKKTLTLKEVQLNRIAKRLFSLYPTAFRYLWYHPESGLWCGASPETLLKVENNSFATMALAGTKANEMGTNVQWTDKERAEQQWVTDSIIERLQSLGILYKKSKVYTHTAGSLQHLRTDITGMFNSTKHNALLLAKELHPTPAVCGTPKQKALQFITDHERYERSFYSGYLGPMRDNEQQVSLFVNLRSMKIEGLNAHLFVGGGIVAYSNPESEWLETHAKLKTMVKVLEPLL